MSSGPFTKRRNRDQRCLKPVVQVLTQMTVGYRRLWIAVGRSNDPYVDWLLTR